MWYDPNALIFTIPKDWREIVLLKGCLVSQKAARKIKTKTGETFALLTKTNNRVPTVDHAGKPALTID